MEETSMFCEPVRQYRDCYKTLEEAYQDLKSVKVIKEYLDIISPIELIQRDVLKYLLSQFKISNIQKDTTHEKIIHVLKNPLHLKHLKLIQEFKSNHSSFKSTPQEDEFPHIKKYSYPDGYVPVFYVSNSPYYKYLKSSGYKFLCNYDLYRDDTDEEVYYIDLIPYDAEFYIRICELCLAFSKDEYIRIFNYKLDELSREFIMQSLLKLERSQYVYNNNPYLVDRTVLHYLFTSNAVLTLLESCNNVHLGKSSGDNVEAYKDLVKLVDTILVDYMQ